MSGEITIPELPLATVINGTEQVLVSQDSITKRAFASLLMNVNPTVGSSLLYGNGLGGFSNATVGVGISFTGGVLSWNSESPSSSGTLTHSGDIVLSGSGKRITGDFSNSTVANRVMFQTSTADSPTIVSAIPTNVNTAGYAVYNAPDVLNASYGFSAISTSAYSFESGQVGAGVYLPMTFRAGGSERLRIATDGSVGIGATPTGKFHVATPGTNVVFGHANGANSYLDGARFAFRDIGAVEKLVLDTANGNATLAGTLAMGSAFGFRNRIINGDFLVSQRGEGATAINAGYSLDRWAISLTGAAPSWWHAYNSHPDGSYTNTLNLIGIAGNTLINIYQRIEAANSWDLAGKQVTASYWVYQYTGSSVAVTTAIDHEITTEDAFSTWGATLVSPAAVVPDSTWTKITATFNLPITAHKGIQLRLWNQGTALLAGKAVFIAKVQLEEGNIATPFEQRPYGYELALCQRYYERKTYSANAYISVGQAVSSTTALASCTYTTKRTPPIVTVSASIVPTLPSGASAGGTWSAATADAGTARLQTTGASGLTAGNACSVLANAGAQYIEISAEL